MPRPTSKTIIRLKITQLKKVIFIIPCKYIARDVSLAI